MSQEKENRENKIDIETNDGLTDAAEDMAADKTGKKGKKRFVRKKKKEQILRIEELEKLLSKSDIGDDIDPESVVSMYVPKRQWKRFGRALLRMDKLHLVLLVLLLAIAILFITAFMQEKMGNFTINLDRL